MAHADVNGQFIAFCKPHQQITIDITKKNYKYIIKPLKCRKISCDLVGYFEWCYLVEKHVAGADFIIRTFLADGWAPS